MPNSVRADMCGTCSTLHCPLTVSVDARRSQRRSSTPGRGDPGWSAGTMGANVKVEAAWPRIECRGESANVPKSCFGLGHLNAKAYAPFSVLVCHERAKEGLQLI